MSASYDGTLRVWDAESGACLRILTEHSVYVNACAWSPDGKRVVSASADKSLKVWDVESGECLRTIEHHVQVNACAWSPDGKRLVSGAWHEKLQVWDAEEAGGRPLLNLTGHSISVNACAWSPDGQRLVSGGADNSMKVWDSTSGQCLWSGYVLPEGQTVSLDGDRKRVLHASDEAWRWIGWRWTEPDTGRLRILPIEAFDPLDA